MPVAQLLFAHPRTGAPSVTLGKTYGSVWRGGGPERAAGADETAATVADLRTLVDDFVASAAQPVYRHDWREGDVVLVDNLATAHLAPPETQRPAAEIGLRVLHRVVVAGTAALAARGRYRWLGRATARLGSTAAGADRLGRAARSAARHHPRRLGRAATAGTRSSTPGGAQEESRGSRARVGTRRQMLQRRGP